MKGICIALGVLLAMAAGAQTDENRDLTKAEKGREAIANCYSGCMAEATRNAFRLRAETPTFALFDDGALLLCSAVQENLRAIDGCRAECVDLEIVYGVASSLARNRFLEKYSNAKLREEAGDLWVDYRNSPDDDTPEFSDACNRWLASSSSGQNPVAAMLSKKAASEDQASQAIEAVAD